MRIPFRHTAGHLVWSTSGSVWAIWRVAPVGGRYVPTRVRDELLGRITSLVRSLAGAPRLFGLAARVDPGKVAEQMVTGLDWQRLPAWAQTTAAGLDLLAGDAPPHPVAGHPPVRAARPVRPHRHQHGDAIYTVRKLLRRNKEELTPAQLDLLKIELEQMGTYGKQIYAAWQAKELLRDLLRLAPTRAHSTLDRTAISAARFHAHVATPTCPNSSPSPRPSISGGTASRHT